MRAYYSDTGKAVVGGFSHGVVYCGKRGFKPLSCKCHRYNHHDTDETIQNKSIQLSEESITIRNSRDITVNLTDTKAAANLQATLQEAIIVLISNSGTNRAQAKLIANDLLQSAKTKQISNRHIRIEGSRNVEITSTDTQLLINIQLLLQLLVAVFVQLNNG
ncbi:spore coat protein [Alteribacter aurantiacus]|uniref:spore coat protein n=1 Tax=Alteribacter aurantiacus TaxID=254410 RepID=UPI0003F8E5D3|nr:spore coat protein [Alteribacter aurantiacus]